MTTKHKEIFSDRRMKHERRTQILSMPAGLDRRSASRRERGFQHTPWWLNVDYSEELVSEKASQVLNSENIRVGKTGSTD